ncbi:MAG: 2-amino-3,7-dideoxy-D-threo-hept-6-ulosonate synthase [Desulfonatronovibrionaceae bacterium]
MTGHKRRLARFFDSETGLTMLVPMDHGVSEGLVPGLDDMAGLLSLISRTPARGAVMHKGMAAEYSRHLNVRQNLVIHLSAGTKHGIPAYSRILVCSVQEALRLGADAVSVHINIGNDLEDRMLSDLGLAVDEAHQAGLPLLAMIYARGEQIVNEQDPSLVAHCIRIGAELGADMIKVPFSGDARVFSRSVASCPVPVLVAGGPRYERFEDYIHMVRTAVDCGARGLSTGRNIFQHPDPAQALDLVWEAVTSSKG